MAEVEGELALTAARALILAGQWELADRLLASVQTTGQAERAALALARAQVAVELRQWRGTGDPAAAVATAAPAAQASQPASPIGRPTPMTCAPPAIAVPASEKNRPNVTMLVPAASSAAPARSRSSLPGARWSPSPARFRPFPAQPGDSCPSARSYAPYLHTGWTAAEASLDAPAAPQLYGSTGPPASQAAPRAYSRSTSGPRRPGMSRLTVKPSCVCR